MLRLDDTNRKWVAVVILRAEYDTEAVADATAASPGQVRAWAAHETMGRYRAEPKASVRFADNRDIVTLAILALVAANRDFGSVCRRFGLSAAGFATHLYRRLSDPVTLTHRRTAAAEEIERAFRGLDRAPVDGRRTRCRS